MPQEKLEGLVASRTVLHFCSSEVVQFFFCSLNGIEIKFCYFRHALGVIVGMGLGWVPVPKVSVPQFSNRGNKLLGVRVKEYNNSPCS